MDDLSTKEHWHHRPPMLAKVVHFIKWWLAFTGLISATSEGDLRDYVLTLPRVLDEDA